MDADDYARNYGILSQAAIELAALWRKWNEAEYTNDESYEQLCDKLDDFAKLVEVVLLRRDA